MPTVLVTDIVPSLVKLSPNDAPKCVDADSRDSVLDLAWWMIDVIGRIATTPEMHSRSRTALYELLAAFDSHDLSGTGAAILQLALSLDMLHASVATARGPLMVDWIVCSLNDPRVDDQTDKAVTRHPVLRTERILPLLEPEWASLIRAYNLVLAWAEKAFIIAAKTALFYAEMRLVFDALLPRLQATPLSPGATLTRISLLGWAATYQLPLAETDIEGLYRTAIDRESDVYIRRRALAVLIACPGREAARIRKNALNLANDEAFSQEPILVLNLLTIAATKPKHLSVKILDRILQVLEELFQRESGSFTTELAFRYRRDEVRAILAPAIHRAATEGHQEWAFKILRAGRLRTRKPLGSSTILLANHDRDLIVSSPDKFKRISRDAGIGIEMVAARNEFRGSAQTILGDAEFVPPEKERPDIVHPSGATRYTAALERWYVPLSLASVLHEMHGTNLTVVPSFGDPIQALTARATGRCWPINVSFERPSRDRALRKALLINTGSFWAQREVESVSLAFEGIIDCIMIHGQEVTRARFLGEFNNPAWDVIWIAGHAAFDANQPDATVLDLGNDERIAMRELPSVPSSASGRRLLFLNVCDGGYGGNFGSAEGIGLAYSLTGTSQAVIANHWTVDGRYAEWFGYVLAEELRHLGAYFPAFANALKLWCGKKSDVVEVLRQRFPDAADSVEREDEGDWDSIFRYGSPAFFQ